MFLLTGFVPCFDLFVCLWFCSFFMSNVCVSCTSNAKDQFPAHRTEKQRTFVQFPSTKEKRSEFLWATLTQTINVTRKWTNLHFSERAEFWMDLKQIVNYALLINFLKGQIIFQLRIIDHQWTNCFGLVSVCYLPMTWSTEFFGA